MVHDTTQTPRSASTSLRSGNIFKCIFRSPLKPAAEFFLSKTVGSSKLRARSSSATATSSTTTTTPKAPTRMKQVRSIPATPKAVST
ncbi:unnamed protein product, partial [Amoebophrya sp. A25]|eukprot:GSA25T00003093001.1